MVNNLFSAISLLWFPNQNRTVFEPRTYGFRTKNIRFWDGNRRRETSAKIIQCSPEVKYIGVYLKNERHFLHHFRAVFSGFCIFLMQNRYICSLNIEYYGTTV